MTKKKKDHGTGRRDPTRHPIDPVYLERLTPGQRKRREQAGQTIYVRLTRYEPAYKRTRHIAGMDLIFQKFTAQEVYDLIKRAGQEHHERAAERRRDAEREAADSVPPEVDD